MNHFLLPVPTLARCVQKAQEELAAVLPHRVLVAALDYAKNVLYFSTLAGQVIVAPIKVKALKRDHQFFTQKLSRFVSSGQFDLILVGHQPTRIYREAHVTQLLAHYSAVLVEGARPQMRYRMITPSLVKKESQRLSADHVQDDLIDVLAINNLLQQGIGSNLAEEDKVTVILRLIFEQMRFLSQFQAENKSEVLGMIERLWPGAVGDVKEYTRLHPELPPLKRLAYTKPLTNRYVRHLLSHCPNPHELLKLGPDGIFDSFDAHGVKCDRKSAQYIYEVFDELLLLPPDIAAIYSDSLKHFWQLYLLYEEQLAQSEGRAVEVLPDSIGHVLTSYPGLTPLLAARYLISLGHGQRFDKASQVWSFAGLAPLSEQPSHRKPKDKPSRRGSPYLRKTLLQIGHLASLHCPECIRLDFLLRQRGMVRKLRTIHIANKVNRVLFRMLSEGEAYRSPLSQDEQEKYLAMAAKRRNESLSARY